jgi:hypothetical protein
MCITKASTMCGCDHHYLNLPPEWVGWLVKYLHVPCWALHAMLMTTLPVRKDPAWACSIRSRTRAADGHPRLRHLGPAVGRLAKLGSGTWALVSWAQVGLWYLFGTCGSLLTAVASEVELKCKRPLVCNTVSVLAFCFALTAFGSTVRNRSCCKQIRYWRFKNDWDVKRICKSKSCRMEQ